MERFLLKLDDINVKIFMFLILLKCKNIFDIFLLYFIEKQSLELMCTDYFALI